MPEESASTLASAGWLHTGDGGYVDADGYIFVREPLKDMINTGREKRLPDGGGGGHCHPNVHDVAVIGGPSTR